MLTITGRKKNIVITSGGKNVDVEAVEPLLRQDPAILDAVLVGDGYDQLGVLVAVDDVFEGDDELALAHAESVVENVNQRFARAEQVRQVGLLPRRLSLDRGELSEDGAVQRSVVAEHFADQISELYN